MKFETIIFEETSPGVGLLTLNRPERLNAMSLGMLDDLYSLFDSLKHGEEIRVLVITGAGRGYCSGADLRDKRFEEEDGGKFFSNASIHLDKIQKRYSGIVMEMTRLPQPIISAVNGAAAGGGLCMALASDIIIAGPDAAFTPSFANIGLSGGELGTSYFLPRMIGIAKASEILLTGRTVYAEEADKIGLVSRLVENEEELMASAFETARVLTGKTDLGLRLTKEALKQNLNAPSLENAIELENRNQSICCCRPEFFEAVANFSKG